MNPIIVPFFIPHHGCPHQCIFCDQIKISSTGHILPDHDEIISRISTYRASSSSRTVEVAFYGGTFTALPQQIQLNLLQPLQPLISEGKISGIRVSTRPDSIDLNCAIILREMGVTTVELGVQSMNDKVLALAERGHSVTCVTDACHVLRGAGLSVGLQLMPGLPGDTVETAVDSLMAVLAHHPDFIRIYPTLVISGTKLEKLYTSGSYHPLSLITAVQLCKIMLHKALVAGVPIIRMGLQPTEELQTPGIVLSGPFHPAFRQVVEAELCFDLLLKLLQEFPADDAVTVLCAPSRVADVSGHKKRNRERLLASTGILLALIKPDISLSHFEFVIEGKYIIRKGHLIRDLSYSSPFIKEIHLDMTH